MRPFLFQSHFLLTPILSLSVFSDDLEYLFGGCESFFKKVEELTWEPVLYSITRLVDHANPHKENEFYVHLVERTGDVITHDDVFVLDMGHKVGRERKEVRS